MPGLSTQIVSLFLLALPVACIAWTVTHEEILREFNDYCQSRSDNSKSFLIRKFFYLFTCEYCFSHYITILVLILSKYTLLLPGWRGYILAGFSIVWIANMYMSIYGWLRLSLKKDRIVAKREEKKLEREEG